MGRIEKLQFAHAHIFHTSNSGVPNVSKTFLLIFQRSKNAEPVTCHPAPLLVISLFVIFGGCIVSNSLVDSYIRISNYISQFR